MREVVLDIETIPCEKERWDEFVQRVPKLEEKFTLEQTALEWSFGRIVCIGMIVSERGADAGTFEELCFTGSDEAGILTSFWQVIRPGDYVIGHNVIGFDLPYIMARSVVCRVKPSRRFDLRLYTTDHLCDTQYVWAQWNRQRFPKLETLAAILGY